MAGTNFYRMKLMIFMIIFLTFFYGSYSVFGSLQTADEFNEDLSNYEYNEGQTVGNGTLSTDYNADTGEGDDFISLVSGLGSYITFGEIEHWFIRMCLNLVSTICFFVIGYIVYSIIRDWVPLVSG